MKTENERLAMDFRDSELWIGDIPSNYTEGKCSKCGKKVANDKAVSFHISNAHGIEYYDYYKRCVNVAFKNA